jgi:high-affinity iron transporter
VLEAFEGFTMLFAVAVLTWMLFWMRSQSAGISRDLRAKMDMALSAGSVTALALLAFSSVGREGLETALFLFAGSANQGSDLSFLLGGLVGFGVAGRLAVITTRHLSLRHFFSISRWS